MPKVSVVIPNYNHARFLDRRMRSVLDQTYQDFEVIFLDDASTDDSLQVFAKYAGDPRVTCIANGVNSGSPFKQWNKGIRHATGDYVWIAESDDYADPRLLEVLLGRLEAHPAVGLAYCQSWQVDEASRIVSSLAKHTADLDARRWERDFVNSGRDECGSYLLVKCTIPNASAVLLRRAAFVQVGGADERMALCGDWMLWAKLLLASDVAFAAEPLNFFRAHGGTVRSRTVRTGVELEEAYRILSYIVRHTAVSASALDMACEQRAEAWVSCLRRRTVTVKRSFEIYSIARDVDKQARSRLLRHGQRRLGAWTRRRLARGRRGHGVPGCG